MLDELDIRDFAIAEHLRLRFAPNFTAITGETGAGKSIIIEALGILLGDRPQSDIVRAGAAAARIEAVFVLPEHDEDLQGLLCEAGIEPEDGTLIVSREIPRGGRMSARVNGRSVVQSLLAAIGGRLVDIHSQSEHLSILKTAEQITYLDRYAGTLTARAALAELVAEVRRVRAEMDQLQADARQRARLQERLTHEVGEIESAGLVSGEEQELRQERSRLSNAEQLAQLATQAYAALEGDGETTGASDALGAAAALLEQLARLDPALAAEAAQLEALQSQAADLARGLRAYSEEVEYNPERLQAIEDRLSVILALKRKYGATIDEVLTYAASASRQLAELGTSEERLAALQERETHLVLQLQVAAAALSRQRRVAAQRLSEAIERELDDLGLARGRFGVRFDLRPDAAGVLVDLPLTAIASASTSAPAPAPGQPVAFDRSGIDRVELLVSLNPGEPLRPLARVASGGETSRLMLALKTILGGADSVPTLVFDEVDVGIGGRAGRIVGEKLAGLAAHHQVICITHLPQIASLADRHLGIAKQVQGERTRVSVRELSGAERVDEVAAMLGAVTASTRASAQELLGQAS